MSCWFVASGNPGTSSFLDMATAAVNFYIRTPAGGLAPGVIKVDASGHHPTWDNKSASTKTLFANQLALFASDIAVDDQVITFDPDVRKTILIGRVTGRYRYEEPSPVLNHPHLLPVEWIGTTDRTALPDSGAGIPRTPNITVRRIYDSPVTPTNRLDDEAPASKQRAQASGRTPRPHEPRTPDGFSWQPPSGEHRYLLSQTFGREGQAQRSFVVVMLNPGANHLAGFRRSTTCHAVRRWGCAHGFDGAVYVNLFTRIEPNSTRLKNIPLSELNGPAADDTLRSIGNDLNRLAIAGWGNLPPGIQRARYDTRVFDVRQLLGTDLVCLGLTQAGYPRHGRGWRHDDTPATLI